MSEHESEAKYTVDTPVGLVAAGRRLAFWAVWQVSAPTRRALRLVVGVELLLTSLAQSADRISRLLDDVEPLPHRVTDVLQAAENVLARIDATASDAAGVVAQVRPVASEADDAVKQVGLTFSQAQELLSSGSEVQRRLDDLLQELEPVLRALAQADPQVLSQLSPLLEHVRALVAGARALDAELVSDATAVIRALPPILDRLDSEVMPAVAALEGLVPVVARLDERVDRLKTDVDDVGTLLSGIPGSQRLWRRGARDSEAQSPPQQGHST